MDPRSIIVSPEDIATIESEAAPAKGAMFDGDAQSVYHAARPVLMVAIELLRHSYPRGSKALAAAVVLLDAIYGSGGGESAS